MLPVASLARERTEFRTRGKASRDLIRGEGLKRTIASWGPSTPKPPNLLLSQQWFWGTGTHSGPALSSAPLRMDFPTEQHSLQPPPRHLPLLQPSSCQSGYPSFCSPDSDSPLWATPADKPHPICGSHTSTCPVRWQIYGSTSRVSPVGPNTHHSSITSFIPAADRHSIFRV